MPSKSKHYGTKAWRVVRRQVLDRDQYRCTIGMEGCTQTATQVDHIHPLAFGGAPFDPGNLRASCSSCNSGRSNKLRRKPSRGW
jgi:5-methylcytosine-specific restriction enzyme A